MQVNPQGGLSAFPSTKRGGKFEYEFHTIEATKALMDASPICANRLTRAT